VRKLSPSLRSGRAATAGEAWHRPRGQRPPELCPARHLPSTGGPRGLRTRAGGCCRRCERAASLGAARSPHVLAVAADWHLRTAAVARGTLPARAPATASTGLPQREPALALDAAAPTPAEAATTQAVRPSLSVSHFAILRRCMAKGISIDATYSSPLRHRLRQICKGREKDIERYPIR